MKTIARLSIVTKTVILFGSLLILSIVNLLFFFFSSTDEAGVLIDISGRNRMLSQRIAFYSCVCIQGNDISSVEKLSAAITLHDKSVKLIKNGGVSDKRKQISGVYRLFKKEIDAVEQLWGKYKLNALAIANGNETQMNSAFEFLKNNADLMLKTNNALVQAIVKRNTKNKKKCRITHFFGVSVNADIFDLSYFALI